MKQTTLLETKEVTQVRDLKAGEHFSGTLRVIDASVATTKKGSPYVRLQLGDKSGTIGAKQWKTGDLSKFEGFVQIEAKAEEYQGEISLKIIDATQVDSSRVNLEDLLPTTDRNINEMADQAFEYMGGLETPELSRFMVGFFEDLWDRYKTSPAATRHHHACVGGLLHHSLSMAEMVVGLGIPGVNQELLIAGALVHDIGKIEEYSVESGFGFTTRGRLIGHVVMGIVMLEKVMPDERPAWADELIHMVASHHGKREWGSPVVPATREALLLHQLDMLDSRLQGAADALGQAPNGQEWTSYLPMFETRLLIEKKDDG